MDRIREIMSEIEAMVGRNHAVMEKVEDIAQLSVSYGYIEGIKTGKKVFIETAEKVLNNPIPPQKTATSYNEMSRILNDQVFDLIQEVSGVDNLSERIDDVCDILGSIHLELSTEEGNYIDKVTEYQRGCAEDRRVDLARGK